MPSVAAAGVAKVMLARALVLAALFPAAALAQKTCVELRAELEVVSARAAVNRLANARCLGGERDEHPAAQRVQRLFSMTKDTTLSAEERSALRRAVLRVVDEYLATLNVPEAAAMRAELEREHEMSYWSWDSTPIDVDAVLARPGGRAAAEGLARATHLAERAYAPDQAAAIDAARSRAVARDARWRSYFADARSQYPWELFVNSWRYEETVRNREGISGPPAWQWIVLHPDVGLQYVDSAAAGDRFKPALVLELIGYNRWTWGGDNRPRNAWGASLVRTYADTASVPSGGWGIAIHRHSKYTLTLNRLEGKTGVLFSIDLVGAVTRPSEEWSDRFRIGRGGGGRD